MRRALSALVLASIATLPAMAHASPPDPIWIAGAYDDGDQDDLIALAAWATGAAGVSLDVHLALFPVEGLPSVRDRAPAVDAPSLVRSRAPPPTYPSLSFSAAISMAAGPVGARRATMPGSRSGETLCARPR